MKCRDIDRITLSKKSWKKTSFNLENKPIVALDTETEKGKAFVIGYTSSLGSYQYTIKSFNDFLNFCVRYKLYNSNNFFYNLDYDINALIKHLPFQKLLELALLNETNLENDVILKIIPNKCLEINYLKRIYRFFDIAQFFNKMKLDDIGEKILGIKKVKLPYDIANLSAEDYFNDYKYKREIDIYLKRDTEITYKLCVHLINVTKKFMNPKYLYSQASFSQQYFLENMHRDYKNQSNAIYDFALKSYNGGRFEILKRGTYDAVRTYDIRSAYPSENIDIPALDTGTWKRNKIYDETALISLLKVEVEGYSHISPMKAENRTMIYYPIGKRILHINKKEYETLKLYNYKVKVLDGYNYYEDNPEYPFTFLNKFYDEKERLGKTHNNYMFYKIIINGFYGKTIQLHSQDEIIEDNEEQTQISKIDNKIFTEKKFKAGLLFNPIVAQEITGNTRSKLLNAVVDIQKDVIGFATDSITSLTKPNIKIGKKLGEWDAEKTGSKRYTCLGSGDSFYEGENMKFRGFGTGYNPNEVIKGNKSLITLPIKRAIKLKATFRTIEKDVNKFNLILDGEKSLNLNFDKKRIWLDKFNNANEVYTKQIESKPISEVI